MYQIYNILLLIMGILGAIVFVALYFIDAGYGKFSSRSWGITVNNRIGWFIMELPVFVTMLILYLLGKNSNNITVTIIFILFEIHYFNRAIIFPMRLKGKTRMPLSIVAMGIIFNIINALMQGGWLFYLSPDNYYGISWLYNPKFIIGSIIFICGMLININSDNIIRDLRRPGDRSHYLPQRGLYRYVTSANYFGEIVEWCGFAILTWSLSGVIFAWWTFANLVPRSNSIYKRYKIEFGEEMKDKNLKRVFPFIY